MATIESVEIRTLESFPVQVHLTAKGYLGDPCTTVSEVRQRRDGNTFRVTIATFRPDDQMCADVIVPLEQNIPLEVQGLKAGTYTVDVNGVTETFELAADNVLP